MLTRLIPSSQEPLPVIGLGTWQTFDVRGTSAYPQLTQTVETLRAAGGTVIDSSPMYGRAEEVVGNLTSQLQSPDAFFYATKVWTQGREAGIRQMEDSLRKLRRPTVDLMQIHNLVDWQTHLRTLREWQAAGKIRYIGITHYTDAMHDELARILATETLDFVQFNYSILDRNAEKTAATRSRGARSSHAHQPPLHGRQFAGAGAGQGAAGMGGSARHYQLGGVSPEVYRGSPGRYVRNPRYPQPPPPCR